MSDAQRVKVKRDGPRGWHWIAASSYDPAKHELVDAPTPVAPAPAPQPPAVPRANTSSTPRGRRAATKE